MHDIIMTHYKICVKHCISAGGLKGRYFYHNIGAAWHINM